MSDISSGVRDATSFCRLCTGFCGMRLKIDADDRIIDIRGDKDQPLTKGYACFKGLQAEEAHHGPSRLLRPLKRQPDGCFAEIPLEQALDEIAERIGGSMRQCGPNSIALFAGNGWLPNSAGHIMAPAFMAAIKSEQIYTPLTIDQSAKIVSAERLGRWAGGVQDLRHSQVVLLFGANPLISHSTIGVFGPDPVRRLKRAREQGLKLICIDPRRTETARNADLLVQPLPGQDAAICAAMIRRILREGWNDIEFCSAHVGAERMRTLQAAVEPFTENIVEARAGLEHGQLLRVTEMFARDAKSGAAFGSTGPNMAPYSNLSQHMIDCLNVICGRFRRAGDRISVDMVGAAIESFAEVVGPTRSWSAIPPSRIRGIGALAGERLASTLPEQILTPGEEQIRCLIVCGGNPASSIPGQNQTLAALRSLDLLVAVEPFMTATARVSDYVLPPKLQYERADLPISVHGFALSPENWCQYTPALLNVPADSELVDDWYVFWAIAARLGIAIDFQGKKLLDTRTAPTADELLGLRLQGSRITLEELRQFPSGKIFDVPDCEVLPAREGRNDLFDVMPADVADELRQSAAMQWEPGRYESNGGVFTHLLACRRLRDSVNSFGPKLSTVRKRMASNYVYMSNNDFTQLGIERGQHVKLTSDAGCIEAIAQCDEDLREGVVTMAHGWGNLPFQDGDEGDSVNLLIRSDRDVEAVNAMPRMSAVPVNITPCPCS